MKKIKIKKEYIILVAVVIIALSWIFIREGLIRRQEKKINDLEFNNLRLEKERADLVSSFKILQSDYEKLFFKNDSLSKVLKKMQKQLSELKEKHKAEIDSLLNIPPDTIYKRLQALYPNTSNYPLLYPFSSAQIKPIYSTAVSYSFLNSEYVLQGKTLNTCLDLNKGYEKSELNLKAQVSNLEKNISLCSQQVLNYDKEVLILKRKVKNRGFWNKVTLGTTLIATGIAILK